VLFLIICQDQLKKQSRTRTVQSFGYLDELEKEYDDPIDHFAKVVEAMNKEELAQDKSMHVKADLIESLLPGSQNRKFFGYAAPNKIFHELGLHTFFINRTRNLKVDYILNNIVKLLVFERLWEPSSRKYAYENKDRYFDGMDFSLDDIYRSLSIISKYEDALQLWIHNKIKEQHTRNRSCIL